MTKAEIVARLREAAAESDARSVDRHDPMQAWHKGARDAYNSAADLVERELSE